MMDWTFNWLSNPYALGAFGLLGGYVGGAAIVIAFFPGIAAWLLGSKAGRVTIFVGAIVLAFLFIAANIFAAGQAKKDAAQRAAQLKVLRSRVKTDSELQRMSTDERKKELDKWRVKS